MKELLKEINGVILEEKDINNTPISDNNHIGYVSIEEQLEINIMLQDPEAYEFVECDVLNIEI